MKKIIQIFIYFLFASAAQAQEFSFQLFFSDAGGNKDTITLGYDPLATNSIDAAFGEVNIITVPRKKSLDVRISDELKNRESNLTIVGTFHTKKQIVPHNCKEANEYANQEIDIATTHWPVTVTWDPLLFNEFCRNGSVFTSMKPGGWFDTGSPSNLGVQILNKGGSKTFKSNAGELFCFKDGNDTISVFWQAFANPSLITANAMPLMEEQFISIFPNPALDKISINTGKGKVIQEVKIYTVMGELVLTSPTSQNVDVSFLVKGIYCLSTTINNVRMVSKLIIKG